MGSFHPGAKSARGTVTGDVLSAEQGEDLMLGSIWMHARVCVGVGVYNCVLGQGK